jgi:hypothetical protein
MQALRLPELAPGGAGHSALVAVACKKAALREHDSFRTNHCPQTLQEHIPAAKLYALGRLGLDNISSNHGSALYMRISSCADWGFEIRKDNLGVGD